MKWICRNLSSLSDTFYEGSDVVLPKSILVIVDRVIYNNQELVDTESEEWEIKKKDWFEKIGIKAGKVRVVVQNVGCQNKRFGRNSLWRRTFASVSMCWDYISAGNNILNPNGHHDQIILLFGIISNSRQSVGICRLYVPKNPVSHHGWQTKKILQFRSSKTVFPVIFLNILFKNIAPFFF